MIQKLGKYKIIEKLGEGAMGAVYKAHDEVLDRYVAIKTMAEDIQWDPELKLRFYREARSAASLHHPNILIIYDLGEEGNVPYIVMELLAGQELKALIKAKLEIPLEKKIAMMVQVADGLQHAHSHGIIHRDVKPGNIHVTPEWAVKILDFGIARIPSSDLTRSGVRLGTPIYMAPEQIREAGADARSDIFSVGIVFYELLTFVHPFRAKNMARTLENIVYQNPAPLDEFIPDAPPRLQAILGRALAKEAGARYASMAEMGHDCRELLAEINQSIVELKTKVQQSLPALEQRARRQGGDDRLQRLVQEGRNLLTRSGGADYVSLKRWVEGCPAAAPPADATVPIPEPPDETRRRGETLLREGQALFKEGKLDEALERLRQAIQFLGPQAELMDTLAEVRKQLDTRNKSRSAEYLESARSAIAERRYPEALGFLQTVLDSDPGNSEGLELQRKARAAMEEDQARRDRQAHGEQEKSTGLKHLAAKKYRESLESLRKAAEIFPDDAAVRSGIGEAENGLREEALQLRIRTDLAGARQLLASQAFDEARSKVLKLLESSPDDPEAGKLIKEIDAAREAKLRRDAASTLVSEAEQLAGQKDYASAAAKVEQALRKDPADARALGVKERIDRAQAELKTQEEIAGHLTRGHQALERRDFDVAHYHVGEVFRLDPRNREAKSLQKAVEKGKRLHEKEQKKSGAAAVPVAGPSQAASALDETVILKRPVAAAPGFAAWAGKLPRSVLWGGLALIVVALAVTLYFMTRQRTPPFDVAARTAEARSLLEQKQVDRATEIAQQILERAPGDTAARGILEEANKIRDQITIENLLLEYQTLKGNGQLEASRAPLQRILAIAAEEPRALSLLEELETAISQTKSKEEQDREIEGRLAQAGSYLKEGKLNESRIEIQRILKLRPDQPAALALLRDWRKAKEASDREQQRQNAAQGKQKQSDELAQKTRAAFESGKYADVQDLAAKWLESTPDDPAATGLRDRSAEALHQIRVFETALRNRVYDQATHAVTQLEKINPSDPRLAEMRKQVEDRRAGATATLTVLALGETGVLTLDGETLGSQGEVENQQVPIGKHQVVVRGKSYTLSRSEEFLDGKKLEWVYDLGARALRDLGEGDRESRQKRKTLETLQQSFKLIHEHGFLRGKCEGTLLVTGTVVEYKPTEGDDHYRWPAGGITLELEGDKLVITYKGNAVKFKAAGAEELRAIKQFWDRIQALK